jgi:hypothetical protein
MPKWTGPVIAGHHVQPGPDTTVASIGGRDGGED